MPSYVIVEVNIADPVRYEEYKKLSGPSLVPFGGRFIVRGGPVEVLEGNHNPGRIVVLEFPSREQAKAWWGSDSYRPAKAIRQAVATTEMILVDGI